MMFATATDQSKATPRPAGTFARVLQLIRPYRSKFAWLIALVLVRAVVDTGTYLIFKLTIDQAIARSNLRLLVIFTGLMLLIPISIAVLGYLQNLMFSRINQAVICDLRTQMFAHVQRLSLRFFSDVRSGEVISRITGEVSMAHQRLSGAVINAVSNIVTMIAAVVLMVSISPVLSLVLFAVLPVYLWSYFWSNSRLKPIYRQKHAAYSGAASFITERLSIAGALATKVFGRTRESSAEFQTHARGVAALEHRQQMVESLGSLVFQTLVWIAPALMFFVAGWQMISGDTALGPSITMGSLVAMAALQGRFFGPAIQVAFSQHEIHNALVSFERVFELNDIKPDIVNRPDAITLQPEDVRGRVEFRDVTFRYAATSPGLSASPELTAHATASSEGGRLILDGVSLTIEPGQIVAIVGRSGAGKSTLGYLLPRLWEPQAGQVLIDGIDVGDIHLDSLSHIVGVVTQEPFMLHATVRENLRFADQKATDAELQEAARSAAIHDRIMQLEHGYDTLVGERGYKLSGGEKQRISLARAILRRTPILLLDEATSALDSESEQLVLEAVRRLGAKRTTLIIAHRLSSVTLADYIVLLQDGRIVEQGRHFELMERGGAYTALFQSQASVTQSPVP